MSEAQSPQTLEPFLPVAPDSRIIELLHDTMRLRKAKFQQSDGTYRGHLPHKISKCDQAKHVSGEITLGFPCSQNAEARFVAIEFDRFWRIVQPRLREVLSTRGVAQAAFCTSGSDEDRGKVIIVLKRPYAQAMVHRLGQHILEDLFALLRIHYEPNDVGIRPTRVGQSVLRIGGRNRNPKRGAVAPDRFLDLDGMPLKPDRIVPAALHRTAYREPAALPAPYPQKFVWRWISKGLPSAIDRPETVRYLTRLAHEVIRCYGRGARAEEHFFEWVVKIEARSLNSGALQNKARSAWTCALYSNKSRKAITTDEHQPEGLCSDTLPKKTAVDRLIVAIVELAANRGLNNLNCLSLSQREIAEARGVAQPTISKAFSRAVKAGRIVIHDAGTLGPDGDKAIFGIVLPGQTSEQVLESGKTHHEVQRRMVKKANYQSKRLLIESANSIVHQSALQRLVEIQTEDGTFEIDAETGESSLSSPTFNGSQKRLTLPLK